MAEFGDVPQKMAYDRASIVFSPEGRLYQVEYARQAVEKAATTLGIVFKDGVVLIASKVKPDLLCDKTEKVFKIDEHIGAASCGLIADSRVMIDFARVQCQINKVTYDEPIEVQSLVKEMSDREQAFTQYAGIRPYGVSFLIAGIDGGEHLFETDPSGTIREWKAHAIGRGANEARKLLVKKYKENMKKEDAVKLGIDTLKKVEKQVSADSIEIGLIEDKKFKIMENSEVKKYVK